MSTQTLHHEDEKPVVHPIHHVDGSGLTIRALLVGSFLGTIVGASNLYLGLKTGFTFGAALFGAIFGFVMLKAVSRIFPKGFGGGYFGPKENCTVQTAATAAGGLGTLFVAPLPAMYRLGLLSADGPSADVGKILALTFISAYYGLFFAVPFRKWFVLRQKLVFPSPFASAVTIAQLHSVTGAAAANKRAKIMAASFSIGTIWSVMNFFMPGLYSWYIFAWMAQAGCEKCGEATDYGWLIQWTPAFIGAGMLTGIHTAGSMTFGSILAWGIIGPILQGNGTTTGNPLGFPKKSKDGVEADAAANPTVRYWLLWPGIAIMIAASFTELFYNWRPMYNGVRDLVLTVRNRNAPQAALSKDIDDPAYDPAPPHEQVPTWMWMGGLVASIISTVVVLHAVFDVGVGEAILSIILAFIFAFIGIQAAGTTDVNPVGAIAKTSQFVFGGISRGKGETVGELRKHAMSVNLLAGAVAASAASQACDMVGDLKTGHLLRASPKSQFIAQAVGTLVAVFASTGLYIFYAAAYPCINDASIEKCSFGLSAVTAWQSIAEVLTNSQNQIPSSSAIASLLCGIITVIGTLAVHKLPAKLAWIIPNFSSIGVAFILNSNHYSIAMLMGALVQVVWNKKNPLSWEVWGFALASGLIAGEGIGGLIQAGFQVASVDQEGLSTWVGCPLDDGQPANCF
ncbi:OPT oligopeptide transporter protein-domain-containing protein [Powellomyces hirtus]|nr:OPT oligopeptide transporter protein-domain-containing protein [Powellomyces hirtus]